MALTSSQVWVCLDRYYDLRQSYPISSPLSQVSGASHITHAGATPAICFLCDVGIVLERLTEAQLDALSVVYHTRRAAEESEAAARNADREAKRTTLADVRDRRMRSKRELKEIADMYRKELQRARRRRDYIRAMDKLAAELEPMVLLGKLARALAAV